MTEQESDQALRVIVQHEIATMEAARESLPEHSHLRTLCSLAMERLQFLIDTRSPSEKHSPSQPPNAALIRPVGLNQPGQPMRADAPLRSALA